MSNQDLFSEVPNRNEVSTFGIFTTCYTLIHMNQDGSIDFSETDQHGEPEYYLTEGDAIESAMDIENTAEEAALMAGIPYDVEDFGCLVAESWISYNFIIARFEELTLVYRRDVD